MKDKSYHNLAWTLCDSEVKAQRQVSCRQVYRRHIERVAGGPPRDLALRSMAEGHLEAGDGRTLALIRVCHDTDAGQSLTCWLLSTGQESTAVRREIKAR